MTSIQRDFVYYPVWSGAGSAVATVWAKVWHWMDAPKRRRPGPDGLELLDDWILRDIGVTRSGIRETSVNRGLEAHL